jgi:hypothetical protein
VLCLVLLIFIIAVELQIVYDDRHRLPLLLLVLLLLVLLVVLAWPAAAGDAAAASMCGSCRA